MYAAIKNTTVFVLMATVETTLNVFNPTGSKILCI